MLGIRIQRVDLEVTNVYTRANTSFLENFSEFKWQWVSGSGNKESACNARPRLDPWVRRIWKREWEPTRVLPGELHRQMTWLATVHTVTQSWTWLTNTFTFKLHCGVNSCPQCQYRSLRFHWPSAVSSPRGLKSHGCSLQWVLLSFLSKKWGIGKHLSTLPSVLGLWKE